MGMSRLFVCFPEVFWWKGTSQTFQMAMAALPLNLRCKPTTANALSLVSLYIKNSDNIISSTGVYRRINKGIKLEILSVQCLAYNKCSVSVNIMLIYSKEDKTFIQRKMAFNVKFCMVWETRKGSFSLLP